MINKNDLNKQEEAQQNSDSEKQEAVKLEQELEQALKKAGENLQGWQRAVADFENYKRRDEEHHKQLLIHGQNQVLLEVIAILEDIDRVLESAPESEDFKEWKKGLEGVRKTIAQKLKDFEVERLPTRGEVFNPEIHEAVSYIDGGEEGLIAEEISSGFKRAGKILKIAKVAVYKGKN